MDEPSPSTDRLRALLDAGEETEAAACLSAFESAEVGAALRALRSLAEEQPTAVTGLLDTVPEYLTHEDRSVRLTTAKLFATVAASEPPAVRPFAPPLADRLADESEFYFVRARAAEALGYVARELPDDVVTPEILAELTVGLAVDQPEVRERLAKALECVAVGNPDRLRHRVRTLAGHLDDDNALVRYHLCSALVAVGSVAPGELSEAAPALADRLDDPEAAVRGRAAEAFGTGIEGPTEQLRRCRDDDAFVAARARFALSQGTDDAGTPPLGTPESVRETTGAAVDSIRSPEGECGNCGQSLPESGPPTCPRCGAPY